MREIIDHFFENGWVVVDLIDPRPVWEARKILQEQLRQISNRNISLEAYHEIAEDDAFHTQMQIQMTAFFRREKLARRVFEKQVSFFNQLVGLDLLIQANPYLRMTRPGKKQDNVGYHRDTFYGGSPYEISVILPFVDCDSKMTLKVMSGSHILSEKLFPVVQEKSDIAKGSEKHKLGFLYAPKLMDPSVEEKMQPVPVKVGQIFMFSLSTVHGCVVNQGQRTRWSSDVRVVNALAPVSFKDRPDYYEPFSSSCVTEAAKRYLQENMLETVGAI